ncbi:MAG: hypothetical protein AAFY82_01700 [Pseudomonadota bacterium]
MKCEIKAANDDPFNIGVEGDVSVEFVETAFDRERNSWATIMSLSGSTRTRETVIYGDSPLQSLRRATAYISALYEPHFSER